jgi:hypothetical protein
MGSEKSFPVHIPIHLKVLKKSINSKYYKAPK